jgi:hypothetical protein
MYLDRHMLPLRKPSSERWHRKQRMGLRGHQRLRARLRAGAESQQMGLFPRGRSTALGEGQSRYCVSWSSSRALSQKGPLSVIFGLISCFPTTTIDQVRLRNRPTYPIRERDGLMFPPRSSGSAPHGVSNPRTSLCAATNPPAQSGEPNLIAHACPAANPGLSQSSRALHQSAGLVSTWFIPL